MTAAPAPTEAQIADAAALRAKAVSLDQKVAAATDSLSREAFRLSAALHFARAAILEDGGYAPFPRLVETKSGRVLDAQVIEVDDKYTKTKRKVWRLSAEEYHRFGRGFVPAGERSRVQKNLGLREEAAWLPARAEVIAPAGGKGKARIVVVPILAGDPR